MQWGLQQLDEPKSISVFHGHSIELDLDGLIYILFKPNTFVY